MTVQEVSHDHHNMVLKGFRELISYVICQILTESDELQ